MSDFPNLTDLTKVGRDEALLANRNLTSEVTDSAGTDANAYIAAAAAIGQELVAQLTNAFASVTLDAAGGQDLDKLVFDRYNLTRKPAGAGLTSLTFTNSVATVTSFAIPVGIIVSTADGIQYVTVVSTTMNVGDTTSSPMQARAVLAGSSSAVRAGTLVNIVTPITGAPTTLSVSNPLASTGADEEEEDDSLRDRARLFFSTTKVGTLKAIEAAALAVPGIRSASAIEVLDSSGRPARSIALIVTDKFTTTFSDLGVDPPSYQTQSQAISTTVFNALSNVRAGGINVEVIVAQVVLQSIALQLTFNAGVKVNSVAFNARAAAANYINNLKPGASLKVAELQAAIAIVPGLSITGGEVASPAGDVVPTTLQVIRTTMELVSAGSLSSSQPLSSIDNPDAYTRV